MDERREEHEGNFGASVKEMSEWDSIKKGTLRKLIVELEDPKREEREDAVEEAEEDSAEEVEDDPVEEVLQENEFHQIFKLIARDELKNCDLKKASSFLAKELSGPSRESAVQQSVKPPKREEGEDAVDDSEEDSVDEDEDDPVDEAEEDSVEEDEDDPVEEVLQENEFHQILKLIAQEESKKCDLKNSSSFLAKELSGSSRESAVQQSVKPVSTVEGFTKRRTESGTESPLTSEKDWKRRKTPSQSEE